ncbi:DJ-1/PfpI family protein [Paenisporosarcina sp. TG20]|uniref:DJ-1/PfpI family protein n=1 Tax=Paenisporosarcina sp. TG20 TaxID=1211706 RepID=UPI0002D97A08|nr:DJ-1/PfpI family protein [Paenisporosarcina sp. TG20]
MKKILFFAYPQYADFEVAHALFLLKKLGNYMITTVSIDGEPVESIGGLWTKAERSLSDIEVADYDLILISGGDGVSEIIDEEVVTTKLIDAKNSGILIAAICASATLLGKAGILEGRKFTCLLSTYENNKTLFSNSIYTGKDIEVDKGVITAKGTAFAEFAVSICDQLGVFEGKEQKNSILKFCKGISS